VAVDDCSDSANLVNRYESFNSERVPIASSNYARGKKTPLDLFWDVVSKSLLTHADTHIG